jgi:uncharacterized protein YggL (DUF469 family)
VCIAKNITEELKEIYNQVYDNIIDLQGEMSRSQALELDILHIIEGCNFSASQGYLLAKKLQKLRNDRRNVKNEWLALKSLRDQLKPLKVTIKNIHDYDKKLSKSSIKDYKPRVLTAATIEEGIK